MLSCCEIFNNSFFHITLPVAASSLYHCISKLLLKRPFSYSKQKPCSQYTRKTLEKSLRHVTCYKFLIKKQYFKDLKNISDYSKCFPPNKYMLNVSNRNLKKSSEDNKNLAEDNPNENIFKK